MPASRARKARIEAIAKYDTFGKPRRLVEETLERLPKPATNLLYYGDNLDVLRRHVKHESVDLVYLDPPFNSNTTYNVLFAEKSGAQAAAQIKAFGDTWRWDEAAARTFQDVTETGGRPAASPRRTMALSSCR